MSTLTVLAQSGPRLGPGAAEGAFCGILIVELALIAVVIAGLWKVFTKAGKPGWACIVPIYNLIVMAEVAGKPGWWGLLCCIPFVGIIFAVILAIGIAENFGKSGLFALGLILLPFIFYPILGFGSAQYRGHGGRFPGPPIPATPIR